MNAENAEMLLRCHRAGRRDDARTEKAVRFAEADPVLGKKLSEQAAFDAQVQAVSGIVGDRIEALAAHRP